MKIRYIVDYMQYTKIGQLEEFEIIGWGINETTNSPLDYEIEADGTFNYYVQRLYRPDVLSRLKLNDLPIEVGFRIHFLKEDMPKLPITIKDKQTQEVIKVITEEDIKKADSDFHKEELLIDDVYYFGKDVYIRGTVKTFHIDQVRIGCVLPNGEFQEATAFGWIKNRVDLTQERYYFEAQFSNVETDLRVATPKCEQSRLIRWKHLKQTVLDFYVDYMTVLNAEREGRQKGVCVSGNVVVAKTQNDISVRVYDGERVMSHADETLTPYVDDNYPLFNQYVQQYHLFINFDIDDTKRYKAELSTGEHQEVFTVNPKVLMSGKISLFEWLRKFWVNLTMQNVRKGLNLLRTAGIKGLLTKVKQLSTKTESIRQNYMAWYSQHRATDVELARQRTVKFDYSPKISIVVPTFRTPENYLREMIESVIYQTYDNWELCIADGSNDDGVTLAIIKEYADSDKRIKYIELEENYGISGNTNECLKMATGDYVGLFDHDDLLALDVLYEVVSTLQDVRHDVIYTDEDKILENSAIHLDPHFKPDFNLGLLRSGNYITHFFVVTREILNQVGGFRTRYDGAQDFDFIFRCTELAKSICHIPKILYHWRIHPNSTAGNSSSKLYAYEAGAIAVHDHLERFGMHANVERQGFGNYRAHYEIPDKSLTVAIVNPQNSARLKQVIDMLKTQVYQPLMILVSYRADYHEIAALKSDYPEVTFVENETKQLVKMMNEAVSRLQTEYVLFIDEYVHMENVGDLGQLMALAAQNGVGGVGAQLLAPNKTLVHAGLVLGTPADPMFIYHGMVASESGYMLHHHQIMDYTALSIKSFLTKVSYLNEIKGFDETYAELFYVDYCLKLRQKGLRLVYTPYVSWIYLKTLEIYSDKLVDDRQKLKAAWPTLYTQGDPLYNVNLSLEDGMKLRQ